MQATVERIKIRTEKQVIIYHKQEMEESINDGVHEGTRHKRKHRERYESTLIGMNINL